MKEDSATAFAESGFDVPKLSRSTLNEEVYEELKQALISGKIAPGSTMSENVLKRTNWAGGGPKETVQSRALKRDEVPDDLVGTAVFLASAESDFMTGQTVVVDGGSAMW